VPELHHGISILVKLPSAASQTLSMVLVAEAMPEVAWVEFHV